MTAATITPMITPIAVSKTVRGGGLVRRYLRLVNDLDAAALCDADDLGRRDLGEGSCDPAGKGWIRRGDDDLEQLGICDNRYRNHAAEALARQRYIQAKLLQHGVEDRIAGQDLGIGRGQTLGGLQVAVIDRAGLHTVVRAVIHIEADADS